MICREDAQMIFQVLEQIHTLWEYLSGLCEQNQDTQEIIEPLMETMKAVAEYDEQLCKEEWQQFYEKIGKINDKLSYYELQDKYQSWKQQVEKLFSCYPNLRRNRCPVCGSKEAYADNSQLVSGLLIDGRTKINGVCPVCGADDVDRAQALLKKKVKPYGVPVVVLNQQGNLGEMYKEQLVSFLDGVSKDTLVLSYAPVVTGYAREAGLADGQQGFWGLQEYLGFFLEKGFHIYPFHKEFFDPREWDEAGLLASHCIYAFSRSRLSLGVEEYQVDLSQKPLVSVVIPSYNRAYCIERAIQSVLHQTYTNLECIVVDDGSTDETEQVVKAIQDSRVQYRKLEKNQGANHARNVGILEAKGEYIAFQDSDDEWLPTKIERCVEWFLASDDEKLGCVYSVMGKYKDGILKEYVPNISTGGEYLMGDIFYFMQSAMFIGMTTAVVKKSVFEQVGMLNEELKRFQDWELFLRIAKEYRFSIIQEELVRAHEQEGSVSFSGTGFVNTLLYVLEFYDMYHTNIEAFNRLTGYLLAELQKAQISETIIQQVQLKIEELKY